MHGKVLLIDEDKCDGCMLCSIACAIVHTRNIDLDRAHIKLWHTEDGLHVPLTCHHCETPSCVAACPTKACREDGDGQRVIISDGECIGCRACNVACPFDHAHYDRVQRVSVKCDYCDGEPECARICPNGAIAYVYSDESSQGKRRQAAIAKARLERAAGMARRCGDENRQLEDKAGLK